MRVGFLGLGVWVVVVVLGLETFLMHLSEFVIFRAGFCADLKNEIVAYRLLRALWMWAFGYGLILLLVRMCVGGPFGVFRGRHGGVDLRGMGGLVCGRL